MDQVVEHVDAVQRCAEHVAVVEAAGDDFNLLQPRHAGDLGRSPDDDFHRVPGLEEPGNQPPADIAGGAGDKHGFGGAVHVDLLGTLLDSVDAKPA